MNMGKKYNYLWILLYIYSCSNTINDKNIVNMTNPNISINKSVDSILDIFLNKIDTSNCQIYLAMYISEERNIVTLIATNLGENYLIHKKPLFYFKKNKIKIYLLTGIEKLFDLKINSIPEVSSTDKYYKTESYVFYPKKIDYIPDGIPLFSPPPNLTIEQDSTIYKKLK